MSNCYKNLACCFPWNFAGVLRKSIFIKNLFMPLKNVRTLLTLPTVHLEHTAGLKCSGVSWVASMGFVLAASTYSKTNIYLYLAVPLKHFSHPQAVGGWTFRRSFFNPAAGNTLVYKHGVDGGCWGWCLCRQLFTFLWIVTFVHGDCCTHIQRLERGLFSVCSHQGL